MNYFNICYFIFIYSFYFTSLTIFSKLFYNFLDINIENFNQITPVHKKWYVVSNLIKSIIFSFMSYHCYFLIKNILFYDKWDNVELLYLGCLYASIDMVGIYIVPKLAVNTFYHHLVVNLMFLYTLLNDMSENTFSKLIVVYALYSVLAFSVNFYLGLRVITKNKKILELLSSFCFVNYVFCCIPNWSFQFYHLCFNDLYIKFYGFIPVSFYSLLMMVVIYDDLVLMKYLKDNSLLKNLLNDGNLNIPKLLVK